MFFFIKNSKFELYHPKDFENEFNTPKKQKKILLTIDDAFESFYKMAWPILKKDKIPFSLEEFKNSLEIDEVHGEHSFNTLERRSIRPCLDVNGIWGGYIGEGAKTVIPSKAFAKISMRLVPHQSDNEITQLFTDYFKSIIPSSLKAFNSGISGIPLTV